MLLSIQAITKRFGHKLALSDVSFDVAEGEIVCLLGPSGCGKTTLLRIIAGLESPDNGRVTFEGQDLSRIPPHRRDFGLMFQDYALFPHKDVFDNVAFGLRMKGTTHEETDTRVHQVLSLVGLQSFERRSVGQLSGGEAQRVALARSLATHPRLLMLDEPLGSLDRALRERLMTELRDILTTVGVTTLYVTHDQAEAFAIGDRAVVLNAGHVEQVGSPEMIYRCPASPFVARFLGLTNLVDAVVTAQGRVTSIWGDLPIATDHHQPGDQVRVLIRPEAASLVTGESSARGGIFLKGRLIYRSFRGGRYRIQLQLEQGPPLTFDLNALGVIPAHPGDEISILLDPAGVVLLPADE